MTTPVSVTQVVMDWITALGWATAPESTGYALFPGPEIISSPDRAVFITCTGGPGYLTEEGGLDGVTFQARVRGPADDPLSPQGIAQALDALVLGASFPAVVDGYGICHIHRMGSPPTPLPLDPQDRRFEYTCSYLIAIGGA